VSATGDGWRAGAPVLRLSQVTVRRAGRTILGPIDWQVDRGQRWVVVGPNGAGKTTLLEVAGTSLWPTTGSVEVLGARVGGVDARELRRRIGVAGSALERTVPPELPAHDVVVTARHAALAPWWHTYTAADHRRADDLLERLGVGDLRDRPFAVLSSGERRRVAIARALMPDPDLLLLDEPAASLDLGAREALVGDLARLTVEPRPEALVLVTHHIEEVPPGFDHGLVLAGGRVVAAGRIGAALTGPVLSSAFGLPVRVDRVDGRFWARGDHRAPR
jgi:iron complex transport system ATP-binding protein